MEGWIDTHAHLYAKQFDKDRDEMLQRAMDSGVKRFYLPNIDRASIDGMLELEAAYPEHCFAMMGLHPCSVKEDYEDELAVVKSWLDKRPFCAVGEIGLDLYWDKTFFEQQKTAFRQQIHWAIELDRPIVIHARDSLEEILEIVTEERHEKLRGIFHCFGGTVDQANRIQELGFLMGIGGVVTYKKAKLDELLPHIPLEKLVLETDAPYLAPVPYRGKRNESGYIPDIGARVAQYKDISIEEVCRATTQNALQLFGEVVTA